VQKGSGDYTWLKVFVSYEDKGEAKTYELTGNGGPLSCSYPKNILEAAQMLNERTAKSVEAHAKQIMTYIKWQEERVAKWELRPLRPVAVDSDALSKSEIVHLRSLLKKEGWANKCETWHRTDATYPRAMNLLKKGYVAQTGTGVNRCGTWITYDITEAGRAFLNQQEQA
jgi:hypothetical protein